MGVRGSATLVSGVLGFLHLGVSLAAAGLAILTGRHLIKGRTKRAGQIALATLAAAGALFPLAALSFSALKPADLALDQQKSEQQIKPQAEGGAQQAPPPVFPAAYLRREAFATLFAGPDARYKLEVHPELAWNVPSKELFEVVLPWSKYLVNYEMPYADKHERMLVDEIRDAPDGKWIGWPLVVANEVPPSMDYSIFAEQVLSIPSHESFSMYFWLPNQPIIKRRDFSYRFSSSWTESRVFGMSADEKWMRMSPLAEAPLWIRTGNYAGTDHYEFSNLGLAGLLYRRSKGMLPLNGTFMLHAGPGEQYPVIATRTIDKWHPLQGLRPIDLEKGDWIRVAYTVLPDEYLPTPCPISSLLGDGRLQEVAKENIEGWVRFRENGAALMFPPEQGCE
jgi:hypothetical protein